MFKGQTANQRKGAFSVRETNITMKKQLIPLFIMSIITLLGALAALFAGFGLYELSEELNEQSASTETAFDDFFMLFGDIVIFVMIGVCAAIFAAAALMGAFGLACAINNGRFAIPCIVFGSVGTAFSVIAVIAAIADGSFAVPELIPILYFGLYTFFSAAAHRYRKATT